MIMIWNKQDFYCWEYRCYNKQSSWRTKIHISTHFFQMSIPTAIAVTHIAAGHFVCARCARAACWWDISHDTGLICAVLLFRRFQIRIESLFAVFMVRLRSNGIWWCRSNAFRIIKKNIGCREFVSISYILVRILLTV